MFKNDVLIYSTCSKEGFPFWNDIIQSFLKYYYTFIMPERWCEKYKHRNFSKIHAFSWALNLEKYGYTHCMFRNCRFMALDIDAIATHHFECPGGSNIDLFMCSVCNRGTSEESTLNNHYFLAHPEEAKVRGISEVNFNKTLPKIISTVRKKSWELFLERKGYIKCLVRNCQFITDDLVVIEQHYQTCSKGITTENLNSICSTCSGVTNNKEFFERHSLLCSVKNCKPPADNFNIQREVTEEILGSWSENIRKFKAAKCPRLGCRFVDNNIALLKNHFLKCNSLVNEVNIICHICGGWLRTPQKLDEHLNSVHKSDDASCNLCLVLQENDNENNFEYQMVTRTPLLDIDKFFSSSEDITNTFIASETCIEEHKEGLADPISSNLNLAPKTYKSAAIKQQREMPSVEVLIPGKTRKIDYIKPKNISSIQFGKNFVEKNSNLLSEVNVGNNFKQRKLFNHVHSEKNREDPSPSPAIEGRYFFPHVDNNVVRQVKQKNTNLASKELTPLAKIANKLINENNGLPVQVNISVEDKSWTVGVTPSVVGGPKLTGDLVDDLNSISQYMRRESYNLLRSARTKNTIFNAKPRRFLNRNRLINNHIPTIDMFSKPDQDSNFHDSEDSLEFSPSNINLNNGIKQSITIRDAPAHVVNKRNSENYQVDRKNRQTVVTDTNEIDPFSEQANTENSLVIHSESDNESLQMDIEDNDSIDEDYLENHSNDNLKNDSDFCGTTLDEHDLMDENKSVINVQGLPIVFNGEELEITLIKPQNDDNIFKGQEELFEFSTNETKDISCENDTNIATMADKSTSFKTCKKINLLRKNTKLIKTNEDLKETIPSLFSLPSTEISNNSKEVNSTSITKTKSKNVKTTVSNTSKIMGRQNQSNKVKGTISKKLSSRNKSKFRLQSSGSEEAALSEDTVAHSSDIKNNKVPDVIPQTDGTDHSEAALLSSSSDSNCSQIASDEIVTNKDVSNIQAEISKHNINNEISTVKIVDSSLKKPNGVKDKIKGSKKQFFGFPYISDSCNKLNHLLSYRNMLGITAELQTYPIHVKLGVTPNNKTSGNASSCDNKGNNNENKESSSNTDNNQAQENSSDSVKKNQDENAKHATKKRRLDRKVKKQQGTGDDENKSDEDENSGKLTDEYDSFAETLGETSTPMAGRNVHSSKNKGGDNSVKDNTDEIQNSEETSATNLEISSIQGIEVESSCDESSDVINNHQKNNALVNSSDVAINMPLVNDSVATSSKYNLTENTIGLPNVQNSSTTGVKRKRGRPKKVQEAYSVDESNTSQIDNISTIGNKDDDSKLGTTSGTVGNEDDDTTESTYLSPMIPQVKRKPGRPRKNPIPIKVSYSDEGSSNRNETQESNSYNNTRTCRERKEYIEIESDPTYIPGNRGRSVRGSTRGRKSGGVPRLSNRSPDQEDSNEMKICAICKESMYAKDFERKHMQIHNFMCWLEGDDPLDLNDESAMVSWLLRFKKKFPKHTFKCEKCGETKKSAKGFLSHLQFCGKTLEERQKLMVTCSICGRVMMPSSLEQHQPLCSRKGPSIKDLSTIDVPLSPRKAAKQCLSTIADIAPDLLYDKPSKKRKCYPTEDEDGDEFLLECDDAIEEEDDDNEISALREEVKDLYTLKTKRITKHLKTIWELAVAEGRELTCPCPLCTYSSLSFHEMNEHYKTCEFDFQGYICKDCKYIATTEKDIIHHVKNLHLDHVKSIKTNFTISQSKKVEVLGGSSYIPFLKKAELAFSHKAKQSKFFRPAVLWTQEQRTLNYASETIFPDFNYLPELWNELKLVEAQQYLPETKQSVKFCTKNNTSDWTQLKLFESRFLNDNICILFTGGPVWGLAWAPGNDDTQYLAISTHLNMQSNFRMGSVHSGPSVVQIWSLERLNNANNISDGKIKLEYVFCHDYGGCWALEWCPAGCQDKSRIGLLAIATTSGIIPLFAVPKPEVMVNHGNFEETRHFKTEPSLLLKLCSFVNSQCTRLSWSKVKPHRCIVGGFTNGIIGVWDLTTQSILLKSDNILYPYKTFNAHHSNITGLCLSPASETYLVSSALDKTVKFWDLNDTTSPHSVHRRGLVNDVAWMQHWLSAVAVYDESYMSSQTTVALHSIRDYVYQPCSLIHNVKSSAWCVSVSDWLNAAAISYDNGQISVVFGKQQDPSGEKRDEKRKVLKVIFETSLFDFEKNEALSMNNSTLGLSSKNSTHSVNITDKPSTSSAIDRSEPRTADCCTFEEVYEKYGIRFDCDINFKEEVTLKGNHPNPIDIYPIMSANKVTWNPNLKALLSLAIGYQSGFVVIPKLTLPIIDQTFIETYVNSSSQIVEE